MERVKCNRQKTHLSGVILLFLFIIEELAFLLLLAYTKFFQKKYMLFILAISVGITGIICFLIRDKGKKIYFTLGCLFMAAVVVAELTGGLYIYRTVRALNSVTGINTETTEIKVFVRKNYIYH